MKNDDVLLPIYVGKAIGDDILEDIQGDNEGDNISYKNRYYCELTGLYWLWKNVEADNYGLFHYRRFLDINNKYITDPQFQGIMNINMSDWNEEAVSNEMQKYDIILPTPIELGSTVYNHYNVCHIIEDLNLVLYIIQKDFPEYAKCAIDFTAETRMFIGNLFIMKKPLFNEFCTWLFAILSKAENKIYLKDRNSYQIRSLAFMAERLFNIFIKHKVETNPALRIKYVPILAFNGI